MKTIKILALASVIGIVAGTVGTTAFANDAFAWHPKGVIKKSVMNQTANGQLSDANDAASAVSAKTGETLKYVIEVRNDGGTGKSNEMHFTKLTDTLPAGVELVSDPSKRDISEDLGVIKPGEKVTKEYLVKVTSAKDAAVIENKACFTGDSEVKDNPQKGCDTANVKVIVPPKEEPKPPVVVPPQETPAPVVPQVKSAETTLPQTGPSALLAPVAAFTTGAVAYVGRLFTIKRRQQ
ncbi:MAG: hypothetical protein AAB834_07935 [Patescibacteria group bacterium]